MANPGKKVSASYAVHSAVSNGKFVHNLSGSWLTDWAIFEI